MAILILILVLAWCAYLLPVAMRRRATRPQAIGEYRRSLSRLSGINADDVRRVGPARLGVSRPVGVSRSVGAARARRARKRRRDVFLGLTATTAGSFAVGLLPGFRVMLGVSLAVGTVLALYAVALLRIRAGAPARAGAWAHEKGAGYAPAYAYASYESAGGWGSDGLDGTDDLVDANRRARFGERRHAQIREPLMRTAGRPARDLLDVD